MELRWSVAFVLLLYASVAVADDSAEAPVITEHPLDVIVGKGQPATLNCAASPASSNITWYKDGVLLTTNEDQATSHRILMPSGALFLLRVNPGKNGKDADAGSYHCVAKNANGEAKSREGILKLAMLREDFRVRPRTVQALAGDKAILECNPPRGFPEPAVTWRKDDKDLRIQDDSRLTLHPDGNLIIEPVQHSDSGAYVCVAENMIGKRVSPPARLSVYEKPKFKTEPRDITVDAGTSVNFDCSVTGEPQPQISWKKANAQMPAQRAFIAANNIGLRIERVQVSDEGEYICQARNPAGSIEASARLRVQAPPQFLTKPEDIAVDQGEKASFECSAGGQPTPALFWSREGQQNTLFPGHISSDGRVEVSSTGLLTITDVRPHDEGVYVCAAMNSAGSSIARGRLSITEKKAVDLRAPPIIEHGPANQTIPVDSSAILPCQAIAGRSESASPTISWLLNGARVDTEGNSRISHHSGGSLHIAELKKTDSGLYTCLAKNEDGESTWTASLMVEEHSNTLFVRMPDPSAFPSVPGTPSFSNVSHDSVDLAWTAPEKNGASPVSGYVLQYYSPEEAQTWYNVNDYVSGTKHRVKNLKPNQSYLFIVRAENEKGIGPPSSPSPAILTKPAPLTVEREGDRVLDAEERKRRLTSEQLIKLEEVKTINATAVRLFWKRRAGNGEPGVVTGYFVKWRGPGADNSMINVPGELTDSAVVSGLAPFTNYEFFIIPYMGSLQGVPSNSMDALTAEARPSMPPQQVHIRMLNLTTLRISWRPPPPEGMNGVLKGFQIVITGTGTKFNRNITTNEKAASVTLFHLIPSMSYKIKVAARTSAGIGIAHGTESLDMTPETLEKHATMYSDEPWIYSIFKGSWLLVVGVIVLWILIMMGCVLFFIRKKKKKIDGNERLGERAFIKINDGSVHMAPPPWGMDAVYNTAPRLHPGGGNTLCHPRINGASQLYSMTPQQHDFYNPYQDEMMGGTLNRPGSEPQYHYAQVTGGPNTMSTFYGNHYQDDPSPYATTTLVTTSQQPAWLSDRMLRGPALPTNPIPNGPPARYASTPGEMGTGRRSRSSRGSEYKANGHGSASDSPPHTDVSYIQSSDGTGGSSNGRSKMGTLSDRRSPPKHNLVDLIPPPPPGAPPPGRDDFYGEFDHNGRRPTSRNRITSRPQKGLRDDESQRSSLMDEDKGRDADSSEADGENSDADAPSGRRGLRPMQPAMGISASTLTQSSYEGRGSTGRFKSMQRTPRNE